MDYRSDRTLPPDQCSSEPSSEWDSAENSSALLTSSAVGRAITGWRALPGNSVRRIIAELTLIQLLQKDAREFLSRSEARRRES